jgi:hypothetical protein
MLSPAEWQHYLEVFSSYGLRASLVGIASGFVLRFTVVLKAKRDDMPEVARAIFKRPKRKRLGSRSRDASQK